MGERRPGLRHPWGPGGGGGGARGRRTIPWSFQAPGMGVLPSLFKARVIQSLTALPSSSLLSSFSSCFDYCFPFASELSPPASLLPTFSLPSPRFASPSPSFLRHRTRRVSFIYLFITPAINTLLGLPSFSV